MSTGVCQVNPADRPDREHYRRRNDDLPTPNQPRTLLRETEGLDPCPAILASRRMSPLLGAQDASFEGQNSLRRFLPQGTLSAQETRLTRRRRISDRRKATEAEKKAMLLRRSWPHSRNSPLDETSNDPFVSEDQLGFSPRFSCWILWIAHRKGPLTVAAEVESYVVDHLNGLVNEGTPPCIECMMAGMANMPRLGKKCHDRRRLFPLGSRQSPVFLG